ncbi:colorectal cancer-associated protein 2 isoform X3 [Dipodomys spectabilis]|uniref:colorectal cancer-associated protein 2 isoform X3 n=1 Tax=Dipodomys spectabilis TaxID=105255 RepID=UPI001C548F0F|nr:colorectal cancer-associated protein 2 isoform X3 [Dipodomys spectabilis]
MSEKPKVYQGVRVKITVKELLQQRRAHQAASGGTLPGPSNVHISDPDVPTSENPSCLDQIFDSYLQTETSPEPLFNSTPSTPYYFPEGFQATPFCFNQSLTPGSPSDSSSLSGSFDYSYSPAQLPSYAPESYNSPPSLDTLNPGFPPDNCSYHHLSSHTQYNCFPAATTSVCYCASCETEHVDILRTSEYFYPSPDCADFAPSVATTSDFYRREANCDLCYS